MNESVQSKGDNIPLDKSRVLEKEFEYLHGSLGKDFPLNGSEVEREIALRKLAEHRLGDKGQWALCLSGGGIRSATFSLGVLQGLAKRGWLDKFHYLSTVSGGGYMGSCLSSWINRDGIASVTEKLSGKDNTKRTTSEVEPQPVRRLRAYSNYLSPVWGLSTDFFTLVSIFLRNLLLNWCVLLPLLATALLIPRWYLSLLSPSEIYHADLIGLCVLAFTIMAVVFIATHEEKQQPASRFLLQYFIPITLGSIFLSYLGKSFLTTLESRELYATLAVPALLLCFWLSTNLWVGLTSSCSSEENREWWARAGSWWLRTILGWAAIFTLVIYVPQWIFLIQTAKDNPVALGVGGGLLGILTSLFGYLSKNGATLKKRAQGIAVVTGMRLLDLAAITFTLALLLGICFANSWALDKLAALHIPGLGRTATPAVTEASGNTNKTPGTAATQASLQSTIASAAEDTALAAKATGEAAKATATILDSSKLDSTVQPSLHKAIVHAANATETASQAMELAAAKMLANGKERPANTYASSLEQDSSLLLTVLLPLLIAFGGFMSRRIGVNTFSLHSMYGNRLVRAYLGATRAKRHPHWFTGFDPDDNLPMAKLQSQDANALDRPRLFHIINIALNIAKPSGDRLEWQQRKAEPFTVSPLHAGGPYIGYVPAEKYSSKTGISLGRAMTISGAAASPNMGYHTSQAVAFVMAFFNIRLGWWLPNPNNGEDIRMDNGPRWGLLYEAFSQSTDKSDYVYLSDGGHFENLGLYEMVRRRCRRIVVVDASSDPEFKFGDLEDAIRKIRIDLGVPIEFDKAPLPTPDLAQRSHRHYSIGTIHYSCADNQEKDGHLYYIKPVLSGDESLDIMQYAANNKEFPHQSTADQFFDEAQFESYRALGQHSVERPDFDLDIDMANWPNIPSNTSRENNSSKESDTSSTQNINSSSAIKSTGSVSSIFKTIQSMSQGVLAASAITIGGVVGVSGTVALQDSTVKLQPGAEVRIRESDMNTLKQGIPLTISQDQNLNSKLDEITNAVKELAAAAKDHNTALPDITIDQTTVQKILMELEAIHDHPANIADISAINTTLGKIYTELRIIGNEKNSGKNLSQQLDAILEQLKNLDNDLSPRRNIRGLEGGTK